MAIETFGVTPTTLANIAQGLSIDALSVPSVTTVTTMIELAGAQVEGEAGAVGITDFTVTTNSTYAILQQMTIALTLADVYAARNSGVDQATYWKARYDSLLETLRKRPQSVNRDRLGPQTGVIAAPSLARRADINRLF